MSRVEGTSLVGVAEGLTFWAMGLLLASGFVRNGVWSRWFYEISYTGFAGRLCFFGWAIGDFSSAFFWFGCLLSSDL